MSPGKHHFLNSQSVESFLAVQLGEVSSHFKGADVQISKADGCYRIHAHAGRRDLIIASGSSEPSAVSQAVVRIHQKLLRGVYGRELAQANAIGTITQQVVYVTRPSTAAPGASRSEPTEQMVAPVGEDLHARRTVGINATQTFWDGVDATIGRSREDRLRRLLKRGLAEIERRLDHEAADAVMSDIDAACRVFTQGRKKQVMLRLEPATYNHVVVAAYAKRMKPAAFCVECIAYALSSESQG